MSKKIFNTWYGNLASSLVALLIAYGFGSWAVDSARILAYVLAVVFFILGINRLAASVKLLIRK